MRRPRATRSVRVRITAVATIVVAATLAGGGWLLVRTVESSLNDDVAERGRARIRGVAQQLSEGVPPDDVRAGIGPVSVQVFDEEGNPIGPQGPGLAGALPVTSLLNDAGGAVGAGGARVEVAAGPPEQLDDAGTVALDVRYETVSGPTGTFTVIAASPLEEVQRSITALKGALLFAYPGLILLVGAVAWLLVGRALRPVEAIRREVESVTATTIHRRVPVPGGGDEVDRLAHTMNAMLDRLEDAAQAQRRFVSDASHELRSPIAAIRTLVEVAREHPEAADWDAVSAAVLGEEARLEGLVSDLLTLARDDEPEPRPTTVVDVASVVRAEAARPRRVPVEVDTEVTAEVAGDRRTLTSAVAHLLDNAARHARAQVRCFVAEEDGVVVVRVDDDGDGVPLADRERVFDRFTRLDEGRARDLGGAGLGLAVVRATAHRHAGTVVVLDAPLGGARLELALPGAVAVGGQEPQRWS
jgi:signal transduction histidine kinase